MNCKFNNSCEIIKKQHLTDRELKQAFNIIKCNMTNLGFNVSEKNKEVWCNSIKNNIVSSNFYFYLVYLNGEIVGFVELAKLNEIFIVSEVQLADKVKRTKIILNIIKFLFECPELANENEVYFSILKNNNMSNKTFSHLGGEIISENEKKYKYSIKRDLVHKYITKLK